MCRDGTEGAAAEASAVHIDRMSNHFVSRDTFAAVARVGHTCVRQVKGSINLADIHGRVHRVGFDTVITILLPEGRAAVAAVALLFDVLEVEALTTAIV